MMIKIIKRFWLILVFIFFIVSLITMIIPILYYIILGRAYSMDMLGYLSVLHLDLEKYNRKR